MAVKTTWLEQVTQISGARPNPQTQIVIFTLANDEAIAVPLNPQQLEGLKKILSPVPVFGESDMPGHSNGHGA